MAWYPSHHQFEGVAEMHMNPKQRQAPTERIDQDMSSCRHGNLDVMLAGSQMAMEDSDSEQEQKMVHEGLKNHYQMK